MEKKVFVDVSARHVHLSQENMDILFGEGAQMTPKKPLGGGFAAEERVTLVGPRGSFERVAILGPVRPTQIEISKTDARALGVNPPVRLSGKTQGSAPIIIVGPKGKLELEEGCIIAKRHIHITEGCAAEYGISQGDVVKVRIETPDRTLVFEDVPCRVQPGDINGPAATMHIDTDECNAAGMDGPCDGYIVE